MSLPPHEGEGEDGGTFGAMTSIIVTYNAISKNDKSRSPLGFLLLILHWVSPPQLLTKPLLRPPPDHAPRHSQDPI